MERKVTVVIGALPEVQGFALARFSRSKPETSFADWILTLSQERAETFYEQFYHKYGHASIADLAHVGLAVEHVSIVAAITLLDEPLLDAQERSTRYMDFTHASFHTPREIAGTPHQQTYESLGAQLFEEYRSFHDSFVSFLAAKFGPTRSPRMDDKAFQETVKAKAFDLARYLLPSSTLTGVGIVASGRTLERHIARLLSNELAEMREIGGEMKSALTARAALNPVHLRVGETLAKAGAADWSTGDLRKEIDFHTYKDCVPLPTLVKYAEARPYASRMRGRMREWIGRKLRDLPGPEGGRGVALCHPDSIEAEMAAGLLYSELPHSFGQIAGFLRSKPKLRDELVALAFEDRDPKDDPPRETAAGFELVFDICMDNGSFRDLHRHRNMVQILKPFDHRLGYDTPEEVHEAGLHERYHRIHQDVIQFAQRLHADVPAAVEYVLPLSFRRRALFKMTFKQLQYLVELRSKPSGHFSYRDIARQIHTAFKEVHPALAGLIRVSPFRPEDFFVR
ncbi:MAG: FAD-dependent thymidylate synthase [Nitrospirae bacterium]|nr:FAD-dependent thymidylate synthase [Nitrospirota bacterium]